MNNRVFKYCTYFICFLGLSGCVAALVAGAAGGMAVYDRRNLNVIEHDARIFYVINTTLVKDPRFQNSHIKVSSFNEMVLLAGQTPAPSLRVLAEKIAKTTPNVRRVYNQIQIAHPTALSQRGQDTFLSSQIRSKLLTKKGLESGSIHIVTEDGVVYLMGMVTPEQADLAVTVARQVNHVQRVVKAFQYIKI